MYRCVFCHRFFWTKPAFEMKTNVVSHRACKKCTEANFDGPLIRGSFVLTMISGLPAEEITEQDKADIKALYQWLIDEKHGLHKKEGN